jgi:glutamine amidotransferase
MIGIVDVGTGNLRSVQMGFARVGAESRFVSSPAELRGVSKLVLPGQGHFGTAMESLRQRGLVGPIVGHIRDGLPFLGICLGLQMLFDVSYEDGEHTGLGVLAGKVVRFDLARGDAAGRRLAVPHMGWNQINYNGAIPLLAGVPSGSYVYFVHSYHVVPLTGDVATITTDYGIEFVSAVAQGNLLATQFHPEKSQAVGLRILENFANL